MSICKAGRQGSRHRASPPITPTVMKIIEFEYLVVRVFRRRNKECKKLLDQAYDLARSDASEKEIARVLRPVIDEIRPLGKGLVK